MHTAGRGASLWHAGAAHLRQRGDEAAGNEGEEEAPHGLALVVRETAHARRAGLNDEAHDSGVGITVWNEEDRLT